MTKKENKVTKFEYYITEMKSDARVEMWATRHIPFEPKDKVEKARNCLNAKIKCLDCSVNAPANMRVRHAVYWSSEPNGGNASDVENLLTYNIRVWTSVSKEWPILRFERAFPYPSKYPAPSGAKHFYSYWMGTKDDGFCHHKLKECCWEINVPLNKFPAMPNQAQYRFWLATSMAIKKKHTKSRLDAKLLSQFALKVDVNLSQLRSICVKNLLDGILTAMHPYGHTKKRAGKAAQIGDVAQHLAGKFSNLEYGEDRMKQLLECKGKPLPEHECFYIKRLIMNPADHNCVAVEVRFNGKYNGPNSDCLHIELFEVTNTRANQSGKHLPGS